jgi:hypothetical protein
MPKVVIKEFGTNKVIKEIPCDSKGKAERVEDGININLNHDKYYTSIEE